MHSFKTTDQTETPVTIRLSEYRRNRYPATFFTGKETGVCGIEVEGYPGVHSLSCLERSLGKLPNPVIPFERGTMIRAVHVFQFPKKYQRLDSRNLGPGLTLQADCGGILVYDPGTGNMLCEPEQFDHFSKEWADFLPLSRSSYRIGLTDVEFRKGPEQLPANKLEVLLKGDPQFRCIWERDRKRPKRLAWQNRAATDWILWSKAMAAGWTYGEAISLLYAYRDEHMLDSWDLRKPGYLDTFIESHIIASRPLNPAGQPKDRIIKKEQK